MFSCNVQVGFCNHFWATITIFFSSTHCHQTRSRHPEGINPSHFPGHVRKPGHHIKQMNLSLYNITTLCAQWPSAFKSERAHWINGHFNPSHPLLTQHQVCKSTRLLTMGPGPSVPTSLASHPLVFSSRTDMCPGTTAGPRPNCSRRHSCLPARTRCPAAVGRGADSPSCSGSDV